ncbi:MAG: hypothetical protein Ct9H300mP12_13580 [Acidimicrobiales bacterium]|nr:MAG: hypothetical protein Ct9H300mP12_13580 [Acidimicrobiales bacterium]
MIQPGGVRSSIQKVDGKAHAAPVSSPCRKREPAERLASERSSRASPRKAAGHQPHGGTDAAISSPAATAPAIEDQRPILNDPPRQWATTARRWMPSKVPAPRISRSSTDSTLIQGGRSATSQLARISPGAATEQSLAARFTGLPM